MRRTVSIVAAVFAALIAAAPAQADYTVVPITRGSGTITSTVGGGCVTANVASSSERACGSINVFSSFSPIIFGTVTLTATAQANPAGHWRFVRWDGCTGTIGGTGGSQCTITQLFGAFTPKAVFDDAVAPTVTPTVTYSTSQDRTVTLSWGANEVVSSFSCSVDLAVFTACPAGNSQTLTLPEGSHSLRARATDLSGNVSATVERTFSIVDTALVDRPAQFSNVKRPTFTFSSVQGLKFDCSVDNVTLAPCVDKDTSNNRGNKTLDSLPDGVHTFRVAARNLGEFDRVPAVYTWTVDTVAPTATLDPTSGPGEGALQAVNKETFKFASNEPGTLECRLDTAAFGPCATDFLVERLSAGPHRFEVRAIDRAGNIGAVVARNWSVAAADNDNDGFNALIDCNDADPTIRPGAVEILDNAVDENCDGIVGTVLQNTKPEQIVVTLAFFAKATKLSTLQVKNVPLGSTVTVTCKGKACPKGLKGKGFTKKNAFGTVSLASFIKKPFRTGDQITVTVSKPGAISAVKVLTARPAKKPSIATKCVPPGTTKPVAC